MRAEDDTSDVITDVLRVGSSEGSREVSGLRGEEGGGQLGGGLQLKRDGWCKIPPCGDM